MNTKTFSKISAVAIIVLSIFTSCNLGKSGKNTEEGLGSTSENGSYIDFYNAFIDIHKAQSDKIEDILEWTTDKYPEDKTASFFPSLAFKGMDYDKNIKTLSAGLDVKVDQKDEINKNMKIYLASINTISNKLEEFKLYRTAEDYKADNWKKGDEIIDSLRIACNNFFSTKETLTPIMTALADKAEAEFIAKDPDKDFIFALKKSMKNTDIFYDNLIDASNGKDKTKVDVAYTEMEKSLTELKSLDATKIKDASRKIYYENYIKYFEEMIAVCRKANNNVKSGTADYEDLGSDIDSKYSLLISSYNGFIN
jgi:hypothetical protein